jgi:2-oxoisovalerate dehydrogenase E1 component alpha subunit
MAALEAAAKVPRPPLSELFTDVYREMPWHLKEQLEQTFEAVRRHPELCPPDMEVR